MVKWLCLYKREVTLAGVNDEIRTKNKEVPGVQSITGTLNTLKDNVDVTGNTNQEFEPSPDENEDDLAPDACCLKGCVSITIVCILVFGVIPTGILLTVYSSSNNDDNALVAGIILIALPLVILPVLAAVLIYKRRNRHTKNSQ